LSINLGWLNYIDWSRRFTQKIEVGRLSCTLCTNPLPLSAFPLIPALPLQLTGILWVRTGFYFRSEQYDINIVIILPPILYHLNPKNVFIWYCNDKKILFIVWCTLACNFTIQRKKPTTLYLLKLFLNKSSLHRLRKTWSNLLLIGNQLTNQHTFFLRTVCN